MLEGARVIVVVPARDEAPRIAAVVRGMPSFVDRVIVVDDASVDDTAEVALAAHDPRVVVERHPARRGVGAAIVTGYRAALADPGSARDAIVVMAGDGQMDPADLPEVVGPIVRGDVDYVKGTRFSRALSAARVMPWSRLVGGLAFSVMTSAVLGRWIPDSQCGYTAMSRAACAALPLHTMWPRYGYPNDLLFMLARGGFRIGNVPVRAVYGPGTSQMRLVHVAGVFWVVARGFGRTGGFARRSTGSRRSNE